jgi:hypothetical protein
MEFIVRQLSARPDTVLVRYDCACGCKPGAEYRQAGGEVGHEHCCCGNVHFVGPDARRRLETYLAERRSQGMDRARGEYTIQETQITTPWAETVPVAFGRPANPGHE